MTDVYVPLDVEAAVIQWLRGRGEDARSSLPVTREAQMIRVSRVGGELSAHGRVDNAEVLVECWGHDQGESFDLAQRLFALLSLAGHLQEPKSIGVTRMDAAPPVSYPDYDAPDMYRHQFTVSITCKTGVLAVPDAPEVPE